MITMKQARKEFAGRVTTYVEVHDKAADEKKTVKRRTRHPRAESFRAWAREHHRGKTDLSPKLRQIAEAR